MSKINRLVQLFIFLILTGSTWPSNGQVSQHVQETEWQEVEEQVRYLVGFIESSFNTLGDPSVSIREKDIIINESFLKFFRDGKVQIEDDLDENRRVVTNKDVQAYLKDITFFFKQVRFDFSIEDVSREINEEGLVFFKVSMQRNLMGTTIEEIPVNNSCPRYIEINLDRDQKDLKIASMYTTKLSENEDMANWWYQLSDIWKTYFSANVPPLDSLQMHQVYLISDSSVIVQCPSDTIQYTPLFDTVFGNTDMYYERIRQMWSLEEVDLSGNLAVRTLDPLKKLYRLRSLDISNTLIDDISPLRNLTHLRRFDCAGTPVVSIEPLHYSLALKELNIEFTLIPTLDVLRNFNELEVLHLGYTPVEHLEPVSALKQLKQLRCSHTNIDFLSPLENLPNLDVLDLSYTHITTLQYLRNLTTLTYLNIGGTFVDDLEPLANLISLEYLYLDYTPVNRLEPLLNLPYLKRIYCDHTLITREGANRFMTAKPGTLVIYETGELMSWWDSIEGTWKGIFTGIIGIDTVPTTEQLHQITLIRKLELNDYRQITDLRPLSVLINLDEIDIAGLPVSSIEPVQVCLHLRSLDLAGTLVASLEPLRYIPSLEWLDVSSTPVNSLEPLRTAQRLTFLNIENTPIDSIAFLSDLVLLATVRADRTNITAEEVDRFNDRHPTCRIIYCTSLLENWWISLPEAWTSYFRAQCGVNHPPGTETLHDLMNLEEITIQNNTRIEDIEPLRIMRRLKHLSLISTRIVDLEPLQAMERLETLTCRESPLTYIGPVVTLKKLLYLDISNTQVADHDQLAMLGQLKNLNISGTPVRDLKWIITLSELTELDISNTSIKKLDDLIYLDNLNVVKCYNTKLNDKKVAKFRSMRPDVEVVFY